MNFSVNCLFELSSIIFTIKNQCGIIILIVKKFACLTISLLTALTALGGVTANAAESETCYPEDNEFIKTLNFTALTDYAVEDGLYAFADESGVIAHRGEIRVSYEASGVTAVDIADGRVYYSCADGTYEIPDIFADTITPLDAEHTFPQKSDEITYNGFWYFVDDDGMNIYDKSTKQTTTESGEYTNLKQYGKKVYAIKENSLYEFTSTEGSKTVLEYADYTATDEILLGQARTALTNYTKANVVVISAGTYMTEVNLKNLGGENFDTSKTVKTEETKTALLLCYSGNSAVVSIENKSFVLLKSKVREDNDTAFMTESNFDAQIIIGGNIYTSPYTGGTIAVTNATGESVKVLNKLALDGVLEKVFYEIEYTSNGEQLNGYVAEGFLSRVIIDDNKPATTVKDPAYSEDSDTKTILIILAVILLVLAAIGYISHVSAKGKKKNKKKSKADGEE